jgi:hypothetical protein
MVLCLNQLDYCVPLPFSETAFFMLHSTLMRLMLPLLPLPDVLILREQNLDFFLLSLYLYIVAHGAAYLLGLVCWLTIIFSGHAAHKVALR